MKFSIGFFVFIQAFLIETVFCGEAVPFWNLTAIKTWDSSLLPSETKAEWNLGLAGFTSALHKMPKGQLNLTGNSHVTLSYFSIMQISDNSMIHLAPNAQIDIRDQSEVLVRESATVKIGPGAQVSMSSSRFTPGLFIMERDSKFLMNEAKFCNLLSKVVLQDGSTLKTESRSQITFIGGSTFELGKESTTIISKSFLDLAADIIIGDRCSISLNAVDFTMVGGSINMKDRVDLKAEPRSTIIVFGSILNFTEGSKIMLDTQSELNLERNSSLVMARRDLRLRIEEKALLKIDQSNHCLMTDDLTVGKQTSLRLGSAGSSSSSGSASDLSTTGVGNDKNSNPSVRCFNNLQKLVEEKNRNFPQY